MKALLITLLIFGSAFVFYDRFLTPEGSRFLFENPPLPVVRHFVSSAAGPDDGGGDPGAPGPGPGPAPAIATLAGSGAFVPPQVESLESLTQNWTVFPPAAFPRHVKLSKPVTLRLDNGTTTVLPAGSHAVAVGAQANVLGISLLETTPAYGQTFVHDTDLPAQVRASYERWKKGRIENALVAWKKRLTPGTAPASVALPNAVDRSGMPLRNPDGGYDLLLTSMRSGDVTDIKPHKIRRWSSPQPHTIDGQPTWVVSVFYETVAFCGPVDAEARAHVRNGRLVRWVYPSGEPVP